MQHGKQFTRNSAGLIALRHTPRYELEQSLNMTCVGVHRAKVLSLPYHPPESGPRPETWRISSVRRRRNWLADELAANTLKHSATPVGQYLSAPSNIGPERVEVTVAILRLPS